MCGHGRRRVRSACSSSTSTASSRSTTGSVTTPATSCSWRWAVRLSLAAFAPATWSPAWVATSSRSCSPASTIRPLAIEVADRICAFLKEQFILGAGVAQISTSIGIAFGTRRHCRSPATSCAEPTWRCTAPSCRAKRAGRWIPARSPTAKNPRTWRRVSHPRPPALTHLRNPFRIRYERGFSEKP